MESGLASSLTFRKKKHRFGLRRGRPPLEFQSHIEIIMQHSCCCQEHAVLVAENDQLGEHFYVEKPV